MTDAITCTFPNNELPFDIEEDGISITGHKYKDGKSKYELEEGHRVKIQRMKKHKLDTEEPVMKILQYNLFNDVKDNLFIFFSIYSSTGMPPFFIFKARSLSKTSGLFIFVSSTLSLFNALQPRLKSSKSILLKCLTLHRVNPSTKKYSE
jgi:hypothetical protein